MFQVVNISVIETYPVNSNKIVSKESVFKVSSFLNSDLSEKNFHSAFLFSFCSPAKLGKVGLGLFYKTPQKTEQIVLFRGGGDSRLNSKIV